MLALRLESAGLELGGRSLGRDRADITYGCGKLRLMIRVDICGDQDGCTSLATPNAIPGAVRVILAG